MDVHFLQNEKAAVLPIVPVLSVKNERQSVVDPPLGAWLGAARKMPG
jgi:hypothetical protein